MADLFSKLFSPFDRYCFLHEVEHYDFSEELDRVADLLTDEENNILMNMVDKCEDLEFSKDPKFDACDYAFELERCWKKVDPVVITIFVLLFSYEFLQFSSIFCLFFLPFWSIITLCDTIPKGVSKQKRKRRQKMFFFPGF